MAEARPLMIDIISDSVCPWCWIGKRRLEKALALRPGLGVDIRWRPYRLNSDVPPKGLDRDELLVRKFGSLEKAREMFSAIAKVGEGDGLAFAFDRIVRAPDTTDSHRLIRWASATGVQDRVVESLFHAFFCRRPRYF